MSPIILISIAVVVIVAFVLVLVGFRSPEAKDPLQTRLAEFGSRDKPVTLQEIEMSQPFVERVIMPVIRQAGQLASRFTPEAALQDTQHQLDLAGNPGNLGSREFMALRIGGAVLLGVAMLIVFAAAPQKNWPRDTLIILGSIAGGYYLPQLWLASRAERRKDEATKSLPDCLDLLTICVEAGLGFDAAMGKISEKWDDELSLAFGRVLQEIRLGKTRREALRDMAARFEVNDITSFVAAVLQAEQLGVSMGKILRIQSDQMRIKRRQRAEYKAHQAPIKMLFPMALFIFPTIWIVLLGPAGLLLKNSALNGILF